MTVVAITSGKGSPGGTFVPVNLSAAMARAGRKVLLLDMDLSGGDVSCYLGLDPRRGLYPLLRLEGEAPEPDRLLAEAEERAGFLAVSGLPEPDDVSSEVLVRLLQAARSTGRTVVADLGRTSDASVAAIREADRVSVVVRPDLVSVLGAQRALRRLSAAGVPLERVGVIISGLDRRRPGDRAEVQDALRVPVLHAIPFDRRGARKALLEQAPARTKRLRAAFDALAERLQSPPSGDRPRAPVEFVGASA